MEMNGHRTTAQIKAIARDRLLNAYGLTIGATLLFILIYVVVLSIVAPVGDGVLSMVWLEVATVIIRLLSGVFVSGSAFLYLNLIYGKHASLADLFHGFKEEPNKAILIQVVYILVSFLCNLPFLIYEWTGGQFALGVELVSLIAIPVASFLITLPISQSYYLLQDFPDRDVRSLLRASVHLMQGQKKRLIRLTLSFVPLFVVCCVTLFIPMLWLRSYYEASLAAFYKDLVEERGA